MALGRLGGGGADPDGRTACPCGTGAALAECCGPHLARTAQPPTAEALMRSRYTAFAVGDAEHLWRTWHPRTRPDHVDLDPTTAWLGLEVTDVVAGGPDDDTGEVAFTARYTGPVGDGAVVERSRFTRRAGRWLYLDGESPGG